MAQAKAIQTTSTSMSATDAQLLSDRDFHGAAIIDEHGKEVPITEEMIQKACDDLGNSWLFPRKAHH